MKEISIEYCGTCRSLKGELNKNEVVYRCMEDLTPNTCWVDPENVKFYNIEGEKWGDNDD